VQAAAPQLARTGSRDHGGACAFGIGVPAVELIKRQRQIRLEEKVLAMIEIVGVIGAGTMGNGIAQVCAAAGLQVVMTDISETAVQRGLATVGSSLERLVKKEKMSAADREAALGRIIGTTDRAKLSACDLVIEAATENEELKLKILKELGAVLNPRALIATNTSSISITKLATATDRPDRFIGMHFFNPVPVMALLELIRGLQTSDDTLAKAEAFAKRVGKVPITARNSPGFAVNRILCPMINEAIFALQEGIATAEEIDAGMKLGCNHPIGPLALADLIGLDTMLSVMEVFYKGFNDPKYRAAPLLKEMVDAGYLGRKSGRGFYEYGKQ
jgi:3-hydroxybutyryl-CoA dehydrogenase